MKSILPWHLLLFANSLAELSPEACDAGKNSVEKDCQKSNIVCDTKIQLTNIEDHEIGENSVFFIESSPKQILSSREACALESASRNSELNVIMVRVSATLDLTDNSTCQIYSR